jgi:hypothetical protein
LVIPNTERVVVNSYLTAVIVCEHELNRVVFRDVYVACYVDHEQVACAVLVRFAVIGTVDVVLNLRTADRIFGCGLDWRYYIDCVVGGC